MVHTVKKRAFKFTHIMANEHPSRGDSFTEMKNPMGPGGGRHHMGAPRRPTVNALHLGTELELTDTTDAREKLNIMGMDPDAQERETDYSEVDEDGNPVKLANNGAALTTFLLLNTMIGSGILNQPFVFRSAGVIGALLGFVLATLSTWLSLNIITDVGIHVKVLEYSGLAKKAFGRAGITAVDVFIVINAFGALLGCVRACVCVCVCLSLSLAPSHSSTLPLFHSSTLPLFRPNSC